MIATTNLVEIRNCRQAYHKDSNADLVVLDRDYLKVPADQIKDIKPLMTMVGGKVVYEAPKK